MKLQALKLLPVILYYHVYPYIDYHYYKITIYDVKTFI